MTRNQLYRVAGTINNRINAPIDIVTICGFMSEDEIKAHLLRYFAGLSPADKLSVLEVARSLAGEG